jgi:Flp pilus assembly pilin Flp
MLNDLVARFHALRAGVGRDETGQTLLEYVLVVGLISVVLVAVLAALGFGVSDMVTSVAGQL